MKCKSIGQDIAYNETSSIIGHVLYTPGSEVHGAAGTSYISQYNRKVELFKFNTTES